MTEPTPEELRRQAAEHARRAERWFRVAELGYGCALVVYGLGLLLALLVGAAVFWLLVRG